MSKPTSPADKPKPQASSPGGLQSAIINPLLAGLVLQLGLKTVRLAAIIYSPIHYLRRTPNGLSSVLDAPYWLLAPCGYLVATSAINSSAALLQALWLVRGVRPAIKPGPSRPAGEKREADEWRRTALRSILFFPFTFEVFRVDPDAALEISLESLAIGLNLFPLVDTLSRGFKHGQGLMRNVAIASWYTSLLSITGYLLYARWYHLRTGRKLGANRFISFWLV